jgi:hypothetical protein
MHPSTAIRDANIEAKATSYEEKKKSMRQRRKGKIDKTPIGLHGHERKLLAGLQSELYE